MEDSSEGFFGDPAIFNFSWEIEGFLDQLEISGVEDDATGDESPARYENREAEWKTDQYLKEWDTVIAGFSDEVTYSDMGIVVALKIQNVQ